MLRLKSALKIRIIFKLRSSFIVKIIRKKNYNQLKSLTRIDKQTNERAFLFG